MPTTIILNSSFIESGLPSGAQWNVTFNGNTTASKSGNILFSIAPGTYGYQIPNQTVAGSVYIPAPFSGSLGAGLSLLLTFTKSAAANTTPQPLNSTLNSTLQQLAAANQILIGNSTVGQPIGLSVSQMSSLVGLSDSQSSNAIRNFKPAFGANPIKSIVRVNRTLAIPYGQLTQGGAYVKAGARLHFLSYNKNHALADYNVTVAKATPKLSIYANGANVTQPNTTITIHVPILPGQTSYNVSLYLNSATNGPNNLNYTYNVKKIDTLRRTSTTTMNTSVFTSSVSRSIKLTSIPINQSVQVTFDAGGNANYTSVDPVANIIPINIIFYLPLTLTNTAPVPTNQPYQQKINFNSQAYESLEAGNLQNIEFFYPNGILIPSWLEGNTYSQSNTVTSNDISDTYWLSVNQIQGSGTEGIDMGFANPTVNLFDGVTVGEAPARTSTYGQYDNGATVFPYYWTFGGSLSALPSGWTLSSGGGSGTFTSANYVIGVASNWGGITSTATYLLTGNVFSIAMNVPSSTAASQVAAFGVGNSLVYSTTYFVRAGHGNKGCDTIAGTTCISTVTSSSTAGAALGYYGRKKATAGALTQAAAETFINANTYPVAQTEVYGIGFGTANTIFFEKNLQSNVLAVLPGTLTLPISVVANQTAGLSIDWIRIYSLPPGNVFPTVTIGSNTGVMQFTESGLPIDTPWNVVYNGALQWNSVPISNTVSFTNTVLTGSHSYTIAQQNGYVPVPSSGSAVLGNTVSVSFNAPLSSGNFLISNPNPPAVSNAVIDVGQYSVINAIISNGIAPYIGNWIWDPPISLTALSPPNTITANILSGGLINSILTINAFTSQNAIFGFNSVNYNLNTLGANSIYGVWNFTGNYIDSAGNFLYPLANASLTINPAFSLNSFTLSNSLIDQGQTQVLSAQISGGTDPYSYNYLVYNSAGLVTNALYTVSQGSGLGLDGSKDTGFVGTAGTSFTISTLTTTSANDLIMVYIYSSGCSAPTITDTAGLTWTKRFDNGANQFFSFYAYSSSQLSGDTITASYGACSVTQHDAVAFGISSPSPLTPFDSNINIPSHVTGTASTTGKSFVTTTHSYDLLLSMLLANHAADSVTLPAGFTQISAATTGNLLYLGYKVVTAQQANAEYDWTLTSDNYQTIGDAAFGDVSSNAFVMTQSSSWGSGPFTYNLFVTDSATTPVKVSSTGNIYGANTALGTPSIAPSAGQSNVVGDNVAFIATLPGGGIGTGPYSYNYIISNTVTGLQTANQLYTGVSSTSNSFTYTLASSDAGNTIAANVFVTDSATTPQTANSIYSGAITVTLSTCTLSVSNTAVQFGLGNSVIPGSSTGPVNAVVDTNGGTQPSYLWVYGSNWLASPQTTNFFVANTIFSNSLGNSGPGFLSNSLSLTTSNTGMLVPATTSNALFLGVNIPPGEASAYFTQNVVFLNVC